MPSYHCIGLMSGTSLDGLDLAHCAINHDSDTWTYQIVQATTLPYSTEWKDRLSSLTEIDGMSLIAHHMAYGVYLGERVKEFAAQLDAPIDLVASHGHTIHHQPDKGYTFQLGYGPSIYHTCGLPVVANFRPKDVLLGGQGAPLVPIGDRLLFGDYAACVNLGGFANLSFEGETGRVAYDICPVNVVLNHLAARAGQDFDRNGGMAAEGTVLDDLLHQLEALPYYQQAPPKSLGIEWTREFVFPLLSESQSPNDLLRTYSEHAARRIAQALSASKGEILFTGGGSYNRFLMERVQRLVAADIVVPDPLLVDYKEALVFALLGVLRAEGLNNCLASVTGASEDHSSGDVFGL